MEWLAGSRIALTPRPAERRESALDVAMLGHCPGRVRLERLIRLSGALDEMRAIGYGDTVDRLLLIDAMDNLLMTEYVNKILLGDIVDGSLLVSGLKQWLSGKVSDDEISAGVNELLDENLVEKSKLIEAVHRFVDNLVSGEYRALYHLPIPLYSSAEFYDIFPDAVDTPAEYISVLAGNRAWLGFAVDDFFANGGEKLWVVRIPQNETQAGFLPKAETRLHDITSLQGLACVLVIPSLGVVSFPDLERLQIPAQLPDIPRKRLENAVPQFLPCTMNMDDSHRERRYGGYGELGQMPDPIPFENVLRSLLQFVTRYRPDVQCLLTLPLSYSDTLESPELDPVAQATLADFKQSKHNAQALRHIQFLFPYLRGPRFALHTPVGLIAGQQVAVTRRYGPWRSIAERPLNCDAMPYPSLSRTQTVALRENPGVSLIKPRKLYDGKIQPGLDDERLVVPALPAADYPVDRQRYDGFRSAEVMRFLGFLRRQLQALGDQLVFNIDYRDPRPRLLLEQLLRRLHARGALRGALPEQAFSIAESQPQEGAVVYEIMLAPAFPIDRLFLTFTNLNGEWRTAIPGVS